jgi:predicted permease
MSPMNPKYLWLTDAMLLVTFYVVLPGIAIVIAYAARRGEPQSFNVQRYGLVCVASIVASFLLFLVAKWINADVRTPQYFLQLGSVLASLLLLGVATGCGFPILLHMWRWHKATRLARHDQTQP